MLTWISCFLRRKKHWLGSAYHFGHGWVLSSLLVIVWSVQTIPPGAVSRTRCPDSSLLPIPSPTEPSVEIFPPVSGLHYHSVTGMKMLHKCIWSIIWQHTVHQNENSSTKRPSTMLPRTKYSSSTKHSRAKIIHKGADSTYHSIFKRIISPN